MRTTGRVARRFSVLATGLAVVLLLGGVLAGLANREVLDGPRFAAHVDALRQDQAVARQIGLEITDRVLTVAPDLVAIRPLLEASATALAASPSFGPIVRAAAQELHGAFTQRGGRQVALRLADVGAVLAGVVRVAAPQAAARLPANLDVTLTHAGDQSFAARTIRLTHIVGVLAWLLPLLAMLALAVGWALAEDSSVAVLRVGWAITAAGVALGALIVLGSLAASRLDRDTLHGALLNGMWREVGHASWPVAAITVLAGMLVVGAAKVRLARVPGQPQSVWSWVTSPPEQPLPIALRAAALVALGVLTMLEPLLILSVLGVLAGLGVLVAGLVELARAWTTRRRGSKPAWRSAARHRLGPALAFGTAAALLLGLLVWDGVPARRQTSTVAAPSAACNGHVQLCDRRYDEVAYPATHNSMAVADEPGWFFAEQPTGLVGQLDAGIRVLLIDSWYGQRTARPGLIATAPGSRSDALADAEQQFGPAAVRSAIRVSNALSAKRVGPVRPYLCHGLCELGATDWEQAMGQVRTWLSTHPREVVTLFVQDEVSPVDTATVFEQAGLLPYVHTQLPGQPWPTLRQMIDSGHRLVVLMENHGGGAQFPWLLQGFDWVQDTPYTNPTVADLSCVRQRGTSASSLFLVNYWLSGVNSLVTDARRINAFDVLFPYLSRCRRERNRFPNFVAVNFYDVGDLPRAVDQLNGVPFS